MGHFFTNLLNKRSKKYIAYLMFRQIKRVGIIIITNVTFDGIFSNFTKYSYGFWGNRRFNQFDGPTN